MAGNKRGLSYMEIIVSMVVLAMLSVAYFRMHRQSLSQQHLAANDSQLMHSCCNLLEKLTVAEELTVTGEFVDIEDYDAGLPGTDLSIAHGMRIRIRVERSGNFNLIRLKTPRKPIHFSMAGVVP